MIALTPEQKELALTAAIDRCIHIDSKEDRVYEIRSAAIEEGAKMAIQAVSPVLLKLRAISTGELRHAFNGMCPDTVEGASTRDPDCPACQALIEADQLLA